MTSVAAPARDAGLAGQAATWFGRRTVAAKMTALLLLVAAVVLTLGGIALARTSTLRAAAHALANDSVRGLGDIGDLSAGVYAGRLDAVDQLISPDPRAVAAYEQEIATHDAQVAQVLDGYVAPGGREGQRVLADLTDAWTRYTEIRDAELIPRGRQDDVTGWTRVRDTELAPLLARVETGLDALRTLEQEAADAAERRADAAGDSARSSVLAVTGGGLALVVALGIGISRAVVRSMRALVAAMARGASDVVASSEQLAQVNERLSGTAEQTCEQAGVASAASGQVATNVQSVATATEQMGASMHEISTNVRQASSVAAEAVQLARETSSVMDALGDSSAEIGKCVKLITSVAEQTNLLALNATIEAARAGTAGKGFAVVANEVKELARATADATEQISARITAIQGDTTSAVTAIGRIAAVIAQIDDFQAGIASAVEEQSAVTGEISRSVVEAAAGSVSVADNLAAVAGTTSTAVEGVATARQEADKLAAVAAGLQHLAGTAVV